MRRAGGGDGTAAAQAATVADATPHRRMIEDFIRAIETGGPAVCDSREGQRSLAVVEAVYRAARERPAEVA